MQKFNLMQVLPSFNSGGVEQGTLDVANYLASLNIKNHITSNGGKMLSYLNKQNINHHQLPVHSKNFLTKPFIARKLNRLIKNEKINILHIRSRSPAWLLPYIDKKNIKTVSTFHNIYGNENIIKNLYNKQLGRVDNIIAISDYVKEEIIKNYNFLPNKIKVINRGIDVNIFNKKTIKENEFITFLKKYSIDATKKIILFPGRLTNWKGQIEFLQIVESFKDKEIMFYFVGDDKNKSYLNKFIKEINKKFLNTNCRILGHLNHKDLQNMYQCSDIIVSAPLKPEGFGRTVAEALSMEKIILAYNFGGVANQLKLLDPLYKIKPLDIEDLINKINIVLELDINIINKMGEKARQHIIGNFSKEIMFKSYFNIYSEL